MENFNEKRDFAVVLTAVIITLACIIGGLATGLTCAIQKRNDYNKPADNHAAQYLLVDSAQSLKKTVSALRLCNEEEPAENLTRTALVHAVRAEAALECHQDNWADSRSKEAFLNDMATVLHSYTPKQTMEMSDMLYKYAAMFCDSVSDGTAFEYNGELIESSGGDEENTEVTDADIEKAKRLVESALSASRVELVGEWSGHIEFYIERDTRTGYAVVCNDKIIEFSFMRDENGGETDLETAKSVALESATACGYDGLSVKWCENTGRTVTVIMCRSYGEALACDDYATAVIFGGETVAFTAGGCDHEHSDIPTVKVDEKTAHRNARNSDGDGTLVVRSYGGRERVCYEYRYELEDGVHYVYVCAENGKQMDVF